MLGSFVGGKGVRVVVKFVDRELVRVVDVTGPFPTVAGGLQLGVTRVVPQGGEKFITATWVAFNEDYDGKHAIIVGAGSIA